MSHDESFRTAAGTAHTNGVVAEWLMKAAADLLTAERESLVRPKPNNDAVCFHAQQAAEKLMKAALIAAGINPPKTHDLVHLDALMQRSIPGWRWELDELSQLSSAAVEVRYPGFSAAAEDAKHMLQISMRVWASLRPRV